MSTSKWYGWCLVYLTKSNLIRPNLRNSRGDVFKTVQVNTIERFANDKMNINSFDEAFVDVDTIGHINLVNDNELHLPHLDESLAHTFLQKYSQVEIVRKDVLLVESYYSNIDGEIEESLQFGDGCVEFELTNICATFQNNFTLSKFDAEIFSRHGKNYSSWWYQQRKDNWRYQLEEDQNIFNMLKTDRCYILLYVRVNSTEIDSLREEYLRYLGGQSKAKCAYHDLCLVRSIEKKLKCSCSNGMNKFEFYRCPFLNCIACICQSCFKNIDDNGTTEFVNPPGDNTDTGNDNEVNDDDMSIHIEQIGGIDENGESNFEDDSNDEDSLEEPYLFENDGDELLAGSGK